MDKIDKIFAYCYHALIVIRCSVSSMWKGVMILLSFGHSSVSQTGKIEKKMANDKNLSKKG